MYKSLLFYISVSSVCNKNTFYQRTYKLTRFTKENHKNGLSMPQINVDYKSNLRHLLNLNAHNSWMYGGL